MKSHRCTRRRMACGRDLRRSYRSITQAAAATALGERSRIGRLAAAATKALADVKQLDAASGSPDAVHEYAIQPFSHLDPVPGPLAVSAPLSNPAVVVSRQLAGPLGDALRLAQAAGKLEQFAAMVATGGPLTADQLASVLS